MNNIIIDCGSYSIKFLRGNFQRKTFKVQEVDEVLLSEYRDASEVETPISEHQQLIIRNYLTKAGQANKTLFQIPGDFLTTRYLSLPVNNRKKANMMIPFQLDDELPFSISDAHYIASISKEEDGNFSAVVEITEKETFSHFYDYLKAGNTLPSVMVSELGVYQAFAKSRKFGSHICIIDIGHETTKAYFIYDDKVLSNHVSSVAGLKIDEVIANSYNISLEEAREYKHKNAFFLTSEQIKKANSEQQEFAKLMDLCFSPLVHQINRWLLGHRVKTGFPVEKVFITGGSANINNLTNYLSEKCEVIVEKLSILSLKNQVGEKEMNSLTLPFLIGHTHKLQEPPKNFLVKDFQTSLTNSIKLEETVFSFYRVALVTLIICLGISIETFYFKQKELKKLTSTAKKALKHKDLNLTNKQRRMLAKKK